MSRLPRWIPDHSLVEISNRCFQGRFLLRPSPALNRAILGVLSRALERHPVQVHYLAVLSNHYHLLVTFPSTGVMSKFMAYFDRNVSIEVGKLYDWRGPMWEGRYHHSIVDSAPAIQIQSPHYWASSCCRFPGCEVTHCDAHHVEHWADGGETKLENLVLVCRRHHRALHEEGFGVSWEAGRLQFYWPNGRRLEQSPGMPRPGSRGWDLAMRLAADGVAVAPGAGMPSWEGGSVDYQWALDGLRS